MKTGIRIIVKAGDTGHPMAASSMPVISLALMLLACAVLFPTQALAEGDGGPGQGPGEAEAASTIDAGQACSAEVERFLTAWTAEDYSLMRAMLSASGREEFVDAYRGHEAEAGRLTGFAVRDAVPAGVRVLIGTSLKFQTEVPPKTTTGLHTFDMRVEGPLCRIADITPISPPAPSRQPGGTFPSD